MLTSNHFFAENILAYISLIKGGLLNYIIMKVIISTNRDVLLDVQGSNIVRVYSNNDYLAHVFYLQWSGQQVQVILSEFYFFLVFIFNDLLFW